MSLPPAPRNKGLALSPCGKKTLPYDRKSTLYAKGVLSVCLLYGFYVVSVLLLHLSYSSPTLLLPMLGEE